MDTHTLDLLEFQKIRVLVASRAACSLGKEAALRIEPLLDQAEIQNRLALRTEMVETIRSGLSPSLGGLHDIRPHVRRARTGAMLEPEELAQTAETLRSIEFLDRWMIRVGEQFPRLGGLRQGVGEFSGVATAIEGCLDSRANVLDTASRRLSMLRHEIAQTEEKIQETLRRMLRSPEIKRVLRYPGFTMVAHHYVLPVIKDHRGEVQGSVQRSSASNETVYIEPTAISEQSAQLSYLRSREAKEIRRILRWLSAQVGMVADALLKTLSIMAEIDLIQACARFSLDYQMTAPDISSEGRLVLREARHPLLLAMARKDAGLPPSTAGRTDPAQVCVVRTEASREGASTAGPEVGAMVGAEGPSMVGGESAPMAGGESAPMPVDIAALPPVSPAEPPRPKQREAVAAVVPIDVHLGVRFQILIVTGPNTGGKTVALKTVGLLAAMAQSGLHVPAAEGSQIPVFDAVLADIGDEQSLEQSLSTFSSHVRRISQILSRATERSLVLLDELGAGTDPAEGAALGRAILDELDSIGCRSIVTTHIGDLKSYAITNPRAENAAVEFDVETLEPRYRLHIGDVGQSSALQIALRLNLAAHIVNRARAYLEQGRGAELPEERELLGRLRKDAEEARQAALRAQAEAERAREALEERLADLEQEARRDSDLADARARVQPGDRVVVPRLGYDRPGRIVRMDPRKKIAVVAIGHVTWNVAIDELIPQTGRPADRSVDESASHSQAGSAPKPGRSRSPRPLEEFDEE
jgi:DNA mismatch repair protein MutS2